MSSTSLISLHPKGEDILLTPPGSLGLPLLSPGAVRGQGWCVFWGRLHPPERVGLSGPLPS